jgi:hypothetical protein
MTIDAFFCFKHAGSFKCQNMRRKDVLSYLNIIWMITSKRMRWKVQVAHMGKVRNAYKILIGKCERNKSLRRLRQWNNNIKMDLGETGWKVNFMFQ